MQLTEDLYVLLKYIFLGVIQGFTEPLPISSSGHVLVLRNIFDLQINGLSFEIIVNVGSLIAVCIVYRSDLVRLIFHSVSYIKTKEIQYFKDFIFLIYLLLASFITASIGLLFESYISHTLNTVSIVGVSLLFTGFALWIIRNLQGEKGDHELSIIDAILIGIAQSVALIPGISRSGTTIVAAMLLGMKHTTALRFSFLLYIPISLGITIMSLNDILLDPMIYSLFIPYLLAFMTSMIVSFFALKWFMHIMKRRKLKYFSFYCFIAGLSILFFL